MYSLPWFLGGGGPPALPPPQPGVFVPTSYPPTPPPPYFPYLGASPYGGAPPGLPGLPPERSFESRCCKFLIVIAIIVLILGGVGYLVWRLKDGSSSSSPAYSSTAATLHIPSSSTGSSSSSVPMPAFDSQVIVYLSASSFTNGQQVTTWPDLSPAGNSFTQTSASSRPIVKYEQGYSHTLGVGFENNAYMVSSLGTFPTFPCSQPCVNGAYTIMSVFYISSNCADQNLATCVIVGSSNNGHKFEAAAVAQAGVSTLWVVQDGNQFTNTEPSVFPYNTIVLGEVTINQADDYATLYINGANVGQASSTSTSQSSNDVYLSSTNSGESLQGSLYEVIIFAGVPNATSRVSWERYFSGKYGLS